jgi:hypothetical protein
MSTFHGLLTGFHATHRISPNATRSQISTVNELNIVLKRLPLALEMVDRVVTILIPYCYPDQDHHILL